MWASRQERWESKLVMVVGSRDRLLILLVGFGLGVHFEVFGPFQGDGIFTQDGESWRHSREMLRPLFSSNCVDNFLQIQGTC